MQEPYYRKLNNIIGWSVGLFAGIVYGLTVEPTASFWDCGEFIAVSNKLEVPHPPGAPLYLMIGRMFSLLAGGDLTRIAYWVNMLSVTASALTIVFMFWTITRLGRRLFRRLEPQGTSLSSISAWSILGAGLLGALIFTFSDSFWFSAVEAEVYGLSSLFTSVIVWSILRWSEISDHRRQWQWILFISYLIGLSIGVHLLGLLALPALTLLVYYKKYAVKTSKIGTLIAISIGLVIVGGIMISIIQGLPSIAAGFDITFVNHLGLPFYSGIIVFLVLLFGGITWGIIWTQRHQRALLNTLLLSLVFVLLGYSSYMLVLIRSLDNPPIDENNPEDVLKFISYLKREQYGKRPLVYGEHFASTLIDQKKGDPVYKKGSKEYEIIDWDIDYVYEDREKMLFPRIYSTRHEKEYRSFLGLNDDSKPTSLDNLRFLFGYQIGYMYLRYLMWNFVGRATDYQDADWLSPLDALRRSSVPSILLQNKGRNNYFALPFILGLIGLFFHSMRDERGFRFVLVLFVLMGVGLVLYLNMPPTEPRARDYIYTGSYYTFSIWIGLSFIAMVRFLGKFLSSKLSLSAAALCALVPVFLMASENWDDHDRSNRYFSVDSARNLLESCAEDAILFTGGDNDTFPLWYAQEVEGIRTDVRVVVLSYFNTDWYISQMMRPAYKSDPLPFNLDLKHYAQGGVNDLLYISPRKDMPPAISLKGYLKLVHSFDTRIQIAASTGSYYNMIPSKDLVLSLDTIKAQAVELPPAFDTLRTDIIYIRLDGRYLEKKDLAILDLISSEAWDRPIYFNHTSLRSINMNMDPYVVQEGLAYRFLPIFNAGDSIDMQLMQDGILVDTERMYDNVMHKFRFRGLDDEDVYFSEDYRNFVTNHRSILSALSAELLKQGDTIRAREVLHYSLERMPDRVIPYNVYNLPTIATALAIGEHQIAQQLADSVANRSAELLAYNATGSEARRYRFSLRKLARLFDNFGDTTSALRYIDLLREVSSEVR